MPQIKSFLMNHYGVFSEICDRDFDFAAYLGPTMVHEMSDDDLSKRVYRIKEIINMKLSSLTMYDLIVCAEYCVRYMKLMKKSDLSPVNRRANSAAFKKLVAAMNGTFAHTNDAIQKTDDATFARELYYAINKVFADTDKMVSQNSGTVLPSPTSNLYVAFGSDIEEPEFYPNLENAMCPKNKECVSVSKTFLREALIKIFVRNYTFAAVLDEAMSAEVDGYGKPASIHPYSWREFISNLPYMTINTNAPDDYETWYKLLAYYNCVCMADEVRFNFIKKFFSGSLMESSVNDIMEEESKCETMSDEKILESVMNEYEAKKN